MSHFTVVEIEATDASCLIEALEALGYRGKIEVHDRPMTLIGYDGQPRLLNGQDARGEIVIRRQHLWEAANDIGFARQAVITRAARQAIEAEIRVAQQHWDVLQMWWFDVASNKPVVDELLKPDRAALLEMIRKTLALGAVSRVAYHQS